jgi:protein TonB
MQPGYYPGREPTGKAFAGSLAAHGVVAGLLVLSGVFHLAKNNFGSPHASSGAVGIDIVKIPVPRREGPVNPLANDSNSVVPVAPTPPKPIKQVKVEPDKAIPIPDKVDKKKQTRKEQDLQSLYKPPEPYKENQVFSRTPQAANSPMFGMKGSGGIDIGPASVLGERFGAYVNLMTDRISQHWNRTNVNASPTQKCHVTFTIARNGAVSNVQVSEASGNYLLDTSAKRAVMDANPLPPLPAQFERNEVTVDLSFQLKQ